jgi:hypothetical protein
MTAELAFPAFPDRSRSSSATGNTSISHLGHEESLRGTLVFPVFPVLAVRSAGAPISAQGARTVHAHVYVALPYFPGTPGTPGTLDGERCSQFGRCSRSYGNPPNGGRS